ncbi:MAG: hypothetical protein NZ933_03690, partial [Bacteroidia bacterium]|nr:hypothetical protein [Bacteroidia bacterium]
FYEGPLELLPFFAQREYLRWSDVSIYKVVEAIVAFLPTLPLEEGIETLVLISRLLRLKVFALLPVPPTDKAERLPSEGAWVKENGVSRLSPMLLQEWERRITLQKFRWARLPGREEEKASPAIESITPMRLFQAYMRILKEYCSWQAYAPTPLPFSPEQVQSELHALFTSSQTWSLQRLWESLFPHPLYRAIAFLFLLAWIHEGRILIKQTSIWEAELYWHPS